MNILFVCTGNTCRSPMAEGYLKSKKLPDTFVKSAGFGESGYPASSNSIEVMGESGIDISSHTSLACNQQLIDWADKIICMTDSHMSILLSAGVRKDKLSVLGKGISDPYGQSIYFYRSARDEIFSAIDELFDKTEIINATLDDAAAIAEIEKVCFSSPWSETAIKDAMNNSTCFFKAVKGQKTVGYVSLYTVFDEGYVNNIAVLPEYRRQGIASLLLEKLTDFAKEKNLSFISLEVRASNISAISLYEKFGYKKEGERKNFYTSPQENAIIMTRRKNENSGY